MAPTMGRKEWLLLGLLSVLFGSVFLFVKLALADLRPFTIVLGRVGGAALVLILLVYVTGNRLPADLRLWGAWQGDTIIGQREMGRFRDDASIGYVNLFYLLPAYRGSGLGGPLDQYAVAFLHRAGHRLARLSVSWTNHQAVAFYLKHHWHDLGPHADHPGTHYMEKTLAATETARSDESGR